MKNEGYHPHSV